MKSLLLLAAVILASCSATSPNTQVLSQDNSPLSSQISSIINGTPVAAENPLAKSVVGIFAMYQVKGESVWIQDCTGTILNDTFILTASHCLMDVKAENLLINFSLNSLSNDNQIDPATRVTDIEKNFTVKKVKSFKVHPQFLGGGDHDLAIIMLQDPVPKDRTAVQLLPDKYIKLPFNRTTLEDQKLSVQLVGFGLFSESPRVSSEVLRMTTVPAQFINQFVITDQSHGTGGCHGDSGGPAFLDLDGQTYQVGVTHGPHGDSVTCGEEGEWVNPALEKLFISDTEKELSTKP